MPLLGRANGFVYKGGRDGETVGPACSVGIAVVPAGLTEITNAVAAIDTTLPMTRRMFNVRVILFCECYCQYSVETQRANEWRLA